MGEKDELIERLCAEAAMVMEDAIPVALLGHHTSLVERLRILAQAGESVSALADAALATMHRQSS